MVEHYKREEIGIGIINRIANRVRNYYDEKQEEDIRKIQEEYTRRKKNKRS